MLSTLSRGKLLAVLATEIFFATLFIVAVAGVSPFIWALLVMASVAGQSVLFYDLGRGREKLESLIRRRALESEFALSASTAAKSPPDHDGAA